MTANTARRRGPWQPPALSPAAMHQDTAPRRPFQHMAWWGGARRTRSCRLGAAPAAPRGGAGAAFQHRVPGKGSTAPGPTGPQGAVGR